MDERQEHMSLSGPDERAVFAGERQQRILALLRAEGRVDTRELAGHFEVSLESIRKDLIHLERHGQLQRVHGGAIPAESASFEPPVQERTGLSREKTRIAEAALAHLPADGSILLDAGSTTERLADLVPSGPSLTVFTNTLPIALKLLGRPNLEVFTLGGRVRSRTLAEVDEWALRSLAALNADVAFLGTNGLHPERGLTTPDAAEAQVKRAMLSSACKRVLLSDHSKIGSVSTVQHATLEDIDLLITDSGITKSQLDELRSAGLAVEVV
ncbi:DeoR/GlpR family DNA-binding transcription regulator [Arthrobacter sp. NPDC090010]|uniref:DeoR/GlpR family DNA-binding transcription regulator n=1 Tax=Arthrobacter sp. NPDC090010 TaxID=3363942 RepID=UPI0037F6CF40